MESGPICLVQAPATEMRDHGLGLVIMPSIDKRKDGLEINRFHLRVANVHGVYKVILGRNIQAPQVRRSSTQRSSKMSHLRYSAYPGWGERARERANMSQAVRIPAGETVQISGQGGWNRATDEIPENLSEEINQVCLVIHYRRLFLSTLLIGH